MRHYTISLGWLLACLLSLFSFAPAHGQQAIPAQVLSLQQCIDWAQSRNLNIRRAEVDSLSGLLSVRSAQSQYLPTAGISVSQDLSLGRSTDKNGVLQDRSSTGTSLFAGASFDLFTGLRRPAAVRAAQLDLQAATARLEQARQDLSLQVVQLYYNVLYCGDYLQATEAQIALTCQLVEKAEAMLKSGKWSQSRLAELQTQLAQEELNKVEAENNLLLARFDLMQLLEWPSDQPELEIERPRSEELLLDARNLLLSQQDWEGVAVHNSPALRAARWRSESAEQQKSMARSGYFPSLSLQLGYNNAYIYLLDKDLRSFNLPFTEQFRSNGRYSVGLSLRIPLFDRFDTSHSVQRADHQRTLAELDRLQIERKLTREVRLAYLNAAAAERKIAAASTAGKQAALALTYAQSGMEAGRISSYDYAQAKTKQLLSTMEELRAKYDFIYKVQLLRFYVHD